jgi:hypothetical protein
MLGLLWGLPVAATQFDVTTLDAEGLFSFFVLIVPLWCATGLILVCSERWFAQRLRPLAAAGLALMVAAAGHELIVLVNSDRMAAVIGHPPLAWSIFFFALWNILCFGSLLLAALAVARRESWTALVVASAEIARNRDDARLRTVDVQNVRGQLSPALLIAAVSELRRRYAEDGERGERLLDKLITFLRAAMPSIRTGRSSLSGELETVKAYAQLLAELDPTRGAWRISIDAALPHARFPPLLLLPALEALSSADPGSPLTLLVKRSKGAVVLEACGPARLDARAAIPMEQRLREGLLGMRGAATVAIDHPSSKGALVISVPTAIATNLKPRRGTATSLPVPSIRKGQAHGS